MRETRSPLSGGRPTGNAWRRAALLVVLMAILIAPFLIQLIPAGGENDENLEEDVPELVQRAVLHYNVSTMLLTGDYNDVNVEELGKSVSDARKTAEQLQSLQEILDWESLSKDNEALLAILARAFITYYHLANASTYYYNAAQLSYGLQESLADALRYLRECRVDEAIEEWALVRDPLTETLELIRGGLREALSATSDDMLSPDHREAYAEGLLRAQGHYVTLKTIVDIMSLASLYREPLEQACQSPPHPGQPGLREALSSMEEQMKDASGPLAYDTYSTISVLKNLFTEEGGQAPGREPTASNDGRGQGAGWGEPESDD